MGDAPEPATDTGGFRPPDAALGEVAVAHAALENASSDVHPTEADLEAFRVEQIDRNRRLRRTDIQLRFLYALLAGAFLLLAYRSQNTDARIQQGLHDACQARVATAQQFNQGREDLIAAVLAGPGAPVDPEAREAAARQLRNGLLLPLEDCGQEPG